MFSSPDGWSLPIDEVNFITFAAALSWGAAVCKTPLPRTRGTARRPPTKEAGVPQGRRLYRDDIQSVNILLH